MEKNYYVYILGSKRNGTLHTGITSDLVKHVWEHKENAVDRFTKKYNIDKLVYFEQYQDQANAISREKRIKKYPRKWKLNLIEKENRNWKDLYKELVLDTPN